MRKLALFVLAWGFVCSNAWSQSSRATLSGRVTDAQGAVVPGADVTVTSDDTSVKQTTKTNNEDNKKVQNQEPTHNSLTISAGGFRPVERHAIQLQTGDQKQIDVQ